MVLIRCCHYPSREPIMLCRVRVASSATLKELRSVLAARLASSGSALADFSRWYLAAPDRKSFSEVDLCDESQTIDVLGIGGDTDLFLESVQMQEAAGARKGRASKRQREGIDVKEERVDEDEAGRSERLPPNVALLMEYPKAELARMNLAATSKADAAEKKLVRAEKDSEETRQQLVELQKQLKEAKAECARIKRNHKDEISSLNEKLNSVNASLKSSSTSIAQLKQQFKEQLIASRPAVEMMKYPNEPLKALYHVLNNKSIVGPEAALSVIFDPRCGADRMENSGIVYEIMYYKVPLFIDTPLRLAVLVNRLDVIKAVIGRLRSSGRSGKTALQENVGGHYPTLAHIATLKNHAEILQYLISTQSDIDVRASNGRRPLHLAAEKGHLECVNLLLECEAKISAADDDGMQPLHWAAKGGHSEVVQRLLDVGAKSKVATYDGKYPLYYADESKDQKTIKILRDDMSGRFDYRRYMLKKE